MSRCTCQVHCAVKRRSTLVVIVSVMAIAATSAVITLLAQSHLGVHLCASELAAIADTIRQLPIWALRRPS